MTRYGVWAVIVLIMIGGIGAAGGSAGRLDAMAALTPTPTPTLEPPEVILAQTQDFSGSNGDWEPLIWTFDSVEMVLVPAGCFEMGSATGEEDEQPVHRVCFEKPFWIDRYEVTNGQFVRLDGQAAEAPTFAGENLPREWINWFEAQDFCTQRGARLPTEAEWEYAARGPDGWEYPWGNEFVPDYVLHGANSGNQPAEVGGYPAGASWVGALDMSGNVWEWVADWYGAYSAKEQVDPTGPTSGDFRVVRGGSWGSFDAGLLRAAERFWGGPYPPNDHVGFRCARPVED